MKLLSISFLLTSFNRWPCALFAVSWEGIINSHHDMFGGTHHTSIRELPSSNFFPQAFIEMRIYPHYTEKGSGWMEYKVIVSANFGYLIWDEEDVIIYYSISLCITKSEFSLINSIKHKGLEEWVPGHEDYLFPHPLSYFILLSPAKVAKTSLTSSHSLLWATLALSFLYPLLPVLFLARSFHA